MTDFTGTSGDDLLAGTSSTDSVFGLAGNDTLQGGRYLYGGAGDDLFQPNWPSSAGPFSYFNISDGTDADTAGGGQDTLDLSNLTESLSEIRFIYEPGLQYLHIRITDGIDTNRSQILVENQFSDDEGYAIETLVIGDQFIDLTSIEDAAMLAGLYTYGTTEGADTVRVEWANEGVHAQGGDDTIEADAEGTHLFGDAGDDRLITGASETYLYGGAGDDTYVVDWSATKEPGADDKYYPALATLKEVATGGSEDILDLSSFVDSLDAVSFAIFDGLDEDPTLELQVQRGDLGHIEYIYITDQYLASANDTAIETLKIGDQLYDLTLGSDAGELNSILKYGATEDSDVIIDTTGQFQSDLIDGMGGNDRLVGRAGNDTLKGGIGDDALNGGDGTDHMRGEDGNDILWGGADFDNLYGGAGDDMLGGGEGIDVLFGGEGSDTLYGGGGDDQVTGEKGNDLLFGGEGADTLTGGDGDDTLFGGAGQDTFIFAEGHGADVLYGFSATEDTLDLSATATGFETIPDVQAAASVQTINGTTGLLIDTGGGASLLLAGQDLDALESFTIIF